VGDLRIGRLGARLGALRKNRCGQQAKRKNWRRKNSRRKTSRRKTWRRKTCG
jgi:hypothetical protein